MDLPTNLGNLLMIAGIGLACWLLLRSSRARLARAVASEPDPKQIRQRFAEPSRDKALHEAPAEVLQWQVELHQTARDLKAEIDSKLSALQALSLIARQEADRLAALLARAEQLDPELFRSLDTHATLQAIQQMTSSGSATDLPPLSPAQRGQWNGNQEQQAQIAQFHERGLSPASIASQLKLPVGEVELALNLLGTKSPT